MKTIFGFLLGVILALGSSFSSGGEEISAPTWKVGDTWVYDIDGVGVPKERRDTVLDVNPSSGVSAVRVATGDVQRTVIFRSDGTIRGEKYPSVHFPMYVGQKWTKKFTYVGRTNGAEYDAVATGEVERIEEVRVPAGTFKAAKIVIRMEYTQKQNQSVSGWIKEEIWYAPEVNKLIKYTSEDYGNLGRDRRIVISLRRYLRSQEMATMESAGK